MMYYFYEKNAIDITDQELSLLVQNLENGVIEPVITHLKLLRRNIERHNQAELTKRAEAENSREFWWGKGIRIEGNGAGRLDADRDIDRHSDIVAHCLARAKGIIAK